MKAHRTKRTAGAAALLAALVMTASGCSSAPAQSAESAPRGQQGAASPTATPGKKLADAGAPVPDKEFTGFNIGTGVVFNWSDADKQSMEKNGLAILKVLIEDHPEYTVAAFKPTQEAWDKDVAPQLKPLTFSTSWPTLTEAWLREVPSEDGLLDDSSPVRNPVLTSRPEVLASDKTGYTIIRSWKSDKGEKCSASDTPYGIDVKGVSITSRVEAIGDASAVFPIISATFDVTVHCQEGGTMTVPQVQTQIPMKKENGEWLLRDANIFASNSAKVITQ
jgi:hypothetical protein